jgi:hypothetical protein
MIFKHAPIIFPVVLALLHISLAIRITSKLTGSGRARLWEGTVCELM